MKKSLSPSLLTSKRTTTKKIIWPNICGHLFKVCRDSLEKYHIKGCFSGGHKLKHKAYINIYTYIHNTHTYTVTVYMIMIHTLFVPLKLKPTGSGSVCKTLDANPGCSPQYSQGRLNLLYSKCNTQTQTQSHISYFFVAQQNASAHYSNLNKLCHIRYRQRCISSFNTSAYMWSVGIVYILISPHSCF